MPRESHLDITMESEVEFNNLKSFPMKDIWMLFKTEDGQAHYFWNGRWPILVNWPTDETQSNYFWNSISQDEMKESEILLLNEIASSKRKKIFSVPGRMRYVVVNRGIFKKVT